jgi:hypothetical protein
VANIAIPTTAMSVASFLFMTYSVCRRYQLIKQLATNPI